MSEQPKESYRHWARRHKGELTGLAIGGVTLLAGIGDIIRHVNKFNNEANELYPQAISGKRLELAEEYIISYQNYTGSRLLDRQEGLLVESSDPLVPEHLKPVVELVAFEHEQATKRNQYINEAPGPMNLRDGINTPTEVDTGLTVGGMILVFGSLMAGMTKAPQPAKRDEMSGTI